MCFSTPSIQFKCFASVILFVGTILTVCIGKTASLNRTEVAHLGAAAYFWKTGQFDLFHVNPPLGRMIAGIPIILSGPKYDFSNYSPRPQDRSEWKVGMAFVAANKPQEVRRMVFLGRCMLIPIILLGGWFGFLLASEIFGSISGIVFLILWSFSPLFLGWGATLCPDMMAASLGMVAAYAFRRWTNQATWKNALISGLAIGLLPLAKTTWIVAFGLFPLLWLLSTNRPTWKQGIIVMVLALYTLNMGYFFDGSFRLLKDYSFISESLRGDTDNRFAESVLGYIPLPFPAEFVQGIDTQRRDFEKGLESYLFGQYRRHGWWYYYFVVLSLKEPLGTLLLFIAALLLAIRSKGYRASWNDEMLVAVPFIVLFAVLCNQTGFSIHPRYLLPAMPFFYLFVSRIGRVFEFKGRIPKTLVASCLIWTMASSLYVHPYSMSYFNELVPVRKRPEILLGSCIDWGQDAYRLKYWLDKHPEASPIRIEYPCPEKVERIGIENAGSPPSQPESGWFALGVNDIYADAGHYAWFKKVEPTATIGYSISIYHVNEVEAERLQKEK